VKDAALKQQKREPSVCYETLEETELVRLAKDGHRDAFRCLIQRCNQKLFRLARGIMRDESDAEDVLQESYVRAFSKFEGFRGEAGVLTWLTRITINEARGRLRTRGVNVRLDEIEAAQKEGAQVYIFPTGQISSNPEAEAARAQIRRAIEEAVDKLPDAYRMVFIMRDLNQQSVEETSDALDLKPATVKTRLHRAHRLLRAALEQKFAAALSGVFPFLGPRCARITDAVLDRLASVHGWRQD
jgi:RNA polymerase sigma-70 factor (ECF subfamily)